MLNNIPNPFAIRRVFVEGLFGQFTYDLKQEQLLNTDSPRFFIIYGDNGSGKTTLLKLIFHMLASEDRRGHKSFLAGIRFKSLAVELESGVSVSAERVNSQQIGSYNFSVRSTSGSSDLFFEADENNSINIKPEDEKYAQYQAVRQSLIELNLSLYFLQDDRKVWIDSVQASGEETFVFFRGTASGRRVRQKVAKDQPTALEEAINRFVLTVKNQAFQASNIGDFNVATIYNDIARSIANSPVTVNELHLDSPIHALINTLEEQSERSEAFAKFGLSSQLSIKELVSTLRGARLETLPILSSVLTPYVNGIKARLDAIQATYSSVRSFVEGINSFYGNKEVEFDLEHGLRIKTSQGERLAPDSLSSGEQQLLLLFCNALTLQQRPTLFLIDEPELSLNIKWQRQLVQALVRSTSAQRIQFLLATHSLELLALHKEHVVRLTSIN